MKKFLHKELAAGRWFELSLAEQLANIGSEVNRSHKWQGKDKNIFWGAVERALELFDLTFTDHRWKGRLREIGRVKELFCDAITGGKEYKSSLRDLDRYFSYYAFYARRNM
jgi:hypothetical protein